MEKSQKMPCSDMEGRLETQILQLECGSQQAIKPGFV